MFIRRFSSSTPTLNINSTIKLANGALIPQFGLGTWRSPPGQVYHAVKSALAHGYRHIDCASIYQNQKEVGAGLKDSGVKRKDVFITSKLWNTDHAPEHVEQPSGDLFPRDAQGRMRLTHVPLEDTWRAMEGLVSKGLVRSIGVSNFNEHQLGHISSHANIKPVMNQIECHPYWPQRSMRAFCARSSPPIAITAYSPLGNLAGSGAKPASPTFTPDATIQTPLQDPVVLKLAEKHKKTSAQILIRWSLQSGLICIPKSVTHHRIVENASVFDPGFELSHNDMLSIDALGEGPNKRRMLNPVNFRSPPSPWFVD